MVISKRWFCLLFYQGLIFGPFEVVAGSEEERSLTSLHIKIRTSKSLFHFLPTHKFQTVTVKLQLNNSLFKF